MLAGLKRAWSGGVVDSTDEHRTRGEAAIAARNFAEAEVEYGALTRLRPEVATYWVGWGQALAELGRRAEALNAFEEALARDPTNAYATRASADLRIAATSSATVVDPGLAMTPAEARELANALSGLPPSSPEAMRVRADAALRRRAWAAAEREFRALTTETPTVAAPWLGLGQALAEQGRHKPAAAAMREALARDPAMVDAAIALADLEAVQGRAEASVALDKRALDLIEASPAHATYKPRLLSRLASRLEADRDWLEAADVLAQAIASAPEEGEYVGRRVALLVRAGLYDQARAEAYGHSRQTGDLLAIHALMEASLAVGRAREARGLAALLARRWTHSGYHQRLHARLTAERFGLGAGDAAFRAGVDRTSAGEDMERGFYEVALAAHDARAAAARLERFLNNHPGDLEAQVAYGYVLANTSGIDIAEMRFERLAHEYMLADPPLRALAHMAMRRRDRAEALRRWRRFGEVYPRDVQAGVETARALFELGDAGEALTSCRRWIANNKPSRDMEQFYAGLLAATGAFEAAETRALEALERFGPAWIALDALIIARGNLGRLQGREAEIIARTPQVVSHDDLKRFYQAVRLLEYFGAAGEVLRAVLPTIPREHDLSWAWPYLRHGEHGLADDPRPAEGSEERTAEARAARDHRRLRAAIGTTTLDRWPEVTATEVTAITDRAAAERPSVHIFNMFEQPNGGSELHALDLGERLKPYADVQFWAPENPHPAVRAEHGATGIGQDDRGHPRGGVLVFVGVYYDLGPWLRQVKPRRVLALYNTFDAVKLSAFARAIHRYTGVKLELLFCSEMMKDEVRLPGLFEASPTDLDEFQPVSRQGRVDRFVIGRHSRDVVEKHDVDDGRVYRALVEQGAEVRLLGATCMKSIFPVHPQIQLLPAQRGGMAAYLNGLDCFYYRTGTWIEPWGRVVIEAMASGLPVVVHERGGYAEAVTSGVDGFVFRTSEEAIEQMSRLKADPELRDRIGAAARAKAETLLGPEALKRLLAFYLV